MVVELNLKLTRLGLVSRHVSRSCVLNLDNVAGEYFQKADCPSKGSK